ncbi:hypothetical protein HOA56_06105 [archaeon]|nr:hypothetical protein [archaeon]
MTEIISILLLIIVGYLTTKIFLKKNDFLQIIGYSIVFSITLVPLIITILFFLAGISINPLKINIPSTVFIMFYTYIIITKKIKIFEFPNLNKKDYIVVGLIIIVGFFSYFFYNNSVYYLSLTSYMERGETNCFYMLTFAMQPELQNLVNSETPYNILSTPGNSLVTSTLHSLLAIKTFKILYVVFQILLFLFTYLLIKHLIKNNVIAIITAIFAIFNPYNLYIEVLDRNYMALVMSVVLLFTVLKYKNKIILHGFFYGIVSGLGLRFLPLIFLIPIFIFYFSQKRKFYDYLIFILIAFLAFGYNIPHLKYHGFNSIGETQNYIFLATNAFTKWVRTPFIPYPSLIFILFQILGFFGLIISSILIQGFFYSIKKSKLHTLMMSSIFIIPLITLAIQRDIIEVPKNRIIIMSFVAIYFFFSYGLLFIFNSIKNKKWKPLTQLIVTILILFIITNLVSKFNFSLDNEFHNKKLLYQKETEDYYKFIKKEFSSFDLTPGFNRLGNKPNLFRKIREVKSVKYNLKKRQTQMQESNEEENNILLPTSNKTEFKIIKIDFDKIVTNTKDSVSIIEESENLFVDFYDENELFDIHYKELNVTWQKELVPLVIFPYFSDRFFINEINIDLNSFISYGEDELGFLRINAINYIFYPNSHNTAKGSGIFALPNFNKNNQINIKIPIDSKIIIRNWFINGANGQPFKIDSWKIWIENNEPKIKFQYNEPESYI